MPRPRRTRGAPLSSATGLGGVAPPPEMQLATAAYANLRLAHFFCSVLYCVYLIVFSLCRFLPGCFMIHCSFGFSQMSAGCFHGVGSL